MRQAKNFPIATVLENLTEGVVVYDKTGKLIYANRAAADITGHCSPEKLIGVSASQLTSKFEIFNWQGNRVKTNQLPSNLAARLKSDSSVVLHYRCKESSEEKWALVKARPILDKQGNLSLVISIIQDITEQVASQRQRELFLNVASHELKTPITSVRAFLELLKRRLRADKHADASNYVGKIERQTKRLSLIVNELLDVARIRAKGLEFHLEKVAIDELVGDTIASLSPIYTSHKITRHLKSHSQVMTDRERLSQVVSNLITNAIKYSPRSKEVIIETYNKDKSVVVRVADFGVGIPPKNLSHIFDSYYRIKPSPLVSAGGIGLGLYISASIISGLGGKIWVESKLNRGSTFYFSLPITNNPD